MQNYEIEVEEDGGQGRWVRASVGEVCTLGELHAWLTEAFELAPRGTYSFTLQGRRESEEASFRGPGEGHWHPAEETELGGLAWQAGRHWIHRHSEAPFRDRQLRVLAVRPDPAHAGAPAVLERGARGRGGGVDGERLASRAAQTARSWRRDVEEQATPSAAELRARLAVARDVHSWVADDLERYERLDEAAGDDGLLWMIELPSQLSALGLHEEALAALAAGAFVAGPVQARGERLLVLARAGRSAEARAEAERWLGEEPDDAWGALYTSDLFESLGEREPADQGLRRAAGLAGDDLELQAAVLERRILHARRDGDAGREAELAGELEGLLARMEALEADEDAEEDGSGAPAAGRNDPCPCGSGMKFQRCCGAGGAAPRSDAAVGVELLGEVARDADQSDLAGRLSAALPRFAGDQLAGCTLASALPLLPDDDLPEALVHWALLDCDLGDGSRVVERTERRLRRAGDRERRLLRELAASVPSLWRVEARVAPGRLRLIDQLDERAAPVEIEDQDGFECGAVLCARILQLDGSAVLGPGPVVARGERGERWLATVRARLDELRAVEPQLAWPQFLKRHAHELYRPLASA